MCYPPFCIICGSKSNWSSDFDVESDLGFQCSGVISHYVCSSHNCNAHLDIKDLLLNNLQEERSIKYYFQDESRDGFYNLPQNKDIYYCLYCGEVLQALDLQSSPQNIASELHKKCMTCDTTFIIQDLYPISLLSNDDDYSDLYYSRTIFLK